MSMPAPGFYTAQMVQALPADGNRYETVHGELLVTPAPRKWHQVVLGRLYVALTEYLRAHPAGHAFFSPADISWGPTRWFSRICSWCPWTTPGSRSGRACSGCCWRSRS